MSTKLTVILMSALLFACANKKDEPAVTRVLVKNANGAIVTTVTVTSSDSSKTATFTAVAVNSTSSAQEISFPALTNAQVSCTAAGCTAGAVNLTASMDNTITVTNGTTPTVTAAAASGSGGW